MSGPQVPRRAPMRSFRTVVWTTLFGSALAAVFFLGRASGQHGSDRALPTVAAASRERPQDARAETRRNLVRRLPALPPSGAGGTGDEPPDTAMEPRVSHAHALLGQVFEKLEAQRRIGFQQAEARALAVVPYLEGVLRGAAEADPAMRAAFSQELASQLCSHELPDDQATTLAHMAMIFPDIPTTQGFDCSSRGRRKGSRSGPCWTPGAVAAWNARRFSRRFAPPPPTPEPRAGS